MTGSSVGAYVEQIDRVLGAGQALYPAPAAAPGIASAAGTSPPVPLGSGLATGTAGAADHYRQQMQAYTGLDAHTGSAAADAGTERRHGETGSTGVRDTARTQAAAIAPATGTAGGVKLLVSRMDERLAAMQHQLDTTNAQNRILATRLRQLAAAYRITTAASPLGQGMAPMMPPMSGLGTLAGTPMNALSGLAVEGPRLLDHELIGPSAQEPAGPSAARAVQYAKTKLGLPYIWGATGPRAYDCSGLVQDAYRHAGISLPRTTYDMIAVGKPVPRSDIRAGDLVLSNFSAAGRPEHVQLAVSPTTVIEAPTPGGHVQYSRIPPGHIVVKRVA